MIEVDLSGCRVIQSLNLHSKSLRELNLNGCSSLKEISVTLEEMTLLELSSTAICALSSSMLSLPKLTYLHLSDCRVIESVNLHSKSLRELYLNGCSSLKEISVSSEEMTTLELSGAAICALSSSMLSLPKLTYLHLSDCRVIESVHLHSKSLRELYLNGCSSLKEISVASDEMIEVDLSGCRVIRSLNFHSKSLKLLRLDRCSSLKEISLTVEKIRKLTFSGTTLCSLPSSIGHLSLELVIFSMLRELNLKDCRELTSLIELPPCLRVLRLDDCRKLVSLPELPPTLYVVSAFNCISLETEITQQLVLQHMLQSWIPYLHRNRPNLWVRDYFAFPGDHIVDKCMFPTAESSIILPRVPISPLCGFIYCIILSEGPVWYDISVSIYQDDAEVWYGWDGWDYNYTFCENPISDDHVILWYHDISKYDRLSEVYDHSRDVTFMFKFDGDKESIKEFGVFPVYATTSEFKLEIFESESIDWEQLPASERRRTSSEMIVFL